MPSPQEILIDRRTIQTTDGHEDSKENLLETLETKKITNREIYSLLLAQISIIYFCYFREEN